MSKKEVIVTRNLKECLPSPLKTKKSKKKIHKFFLWRTILCFPEYNVTSRVNTHPSQTSRLRVKVFRLSVFFQQFYSQIFLSYFITEGPYITCSSDKLFPNLHWFVWESRAVSCIIRVLSEQDKSGSCSLLCIQQLLTISVFIHFRAMSTCGHAFAPHKITIWMKLLAINSSPIFINPCELI